jgi:hypothetical protein
MKADKKGPELFIITEHLFQGLENMAGICRKNRDYETAELLTQAKIGLSKVPAITPVVNTIAMGLRTQAAELIKLADSLEQLFPATKSQENSSEEKK